MKNFLGVLLVLIASSTMCHATTFYLDASALDETGTGTIEAPFKTLAQAQSVVVSGDTVNIYSGDYGGFSEVDVARTDYVVWQAIEGEVVHFDYIFLPHTVTTDSYLRFVRINVMPPTRDTCAVVREGCNDPQWPTSTSLTYTKTDYPFYATDINYIQLIDCVLSGPGSRHLTPGGFYAINANHVLIEGSEITRVIHGIRINGGGVDHVIRNNHIHHFVGSGISSLGVGYQGLLYENNHIHDSIDQYWSDDWSAKAPGSNVHGSGISIRDGNVTIRGNIIHDADGIMAYEDDAGNDYVNENMLIENNLVYDIGGLYALRIYEAGPNIVVRNNTLIARSRYDDPAAVTQYRTAFTVEGVDEQNGPASIEVYNNTLIGQSNFNLPEITESNNIVWSYYKYYNAKYWQCSSDIQGISNTFIYACRAGDESSLPLFDLFANDPNMTFTFGTAENTEQGHQMILDFTIAETSLAYNFGDPLQQPTKSLGVLDANNEFILDTNPLRSSGAPVAGAYGAGAIYSLYNSTTPTGRPQFFKTSASGQLLLNGGGFLQLQQ